MTEQTEHEQGEQNERRPVLEWREKIGHYVALVGKHCRLVVDPKRDAGFSWWVSVPGSCLACSYDVEQNPAPTLLAAQLAAEDAARSAGIAVPLGGVRCPSCRKRDVIVCGDLRSCRTCGHAWGPGCYDGVYSDLAGEVERLTQRLSVQNARLVDLIAAAERTLERFDYAGMLARGIEHETLGGLATALDAAKQTRVYADPDDPHLGAGDPRVDPNAAIATLLAEGHAERMRAALGLLPPDGSPGHFDAHRNQTAACAECGAKIPPGVRIAVYLTGCSAYACSGACADALRQEAQPDREDRAFEALLVAAHRGVAPAEIAQRDTKPSTADLPDLAPEDRAALDALGPDLVDRIWKQQEVARAAHAHLLAEVERLTQRIADLTSGRHLDALLEAARAVLDWWDADGCIDINESARPRFAALEAAVEAAESQANPAP